MAILYPNPCYDEACYNGTALYLLVQKCPFSHVAAQF